MKKLLLIIFMFCTTFVYATDRIKNAKASLTSYSFDFYIEVEYELDKNVYVSDEIPQINKYYSIKMEDRILKIVYYPRGNLIKIADESTHYPPLVRQVQNGHKLAFSINLGQIIRNSEFSFNDIDAIDITVVDAIFYTERNFVQTFLTRDELYSIHYIRGDVIRIEKKDYERYWIN